MKHILALILFFVISVANADTFYVANNGKVEAYLLGSQAGYTNMFSASFEDPNVSPAYFSTWLSNKGLIGSSIDFGTQIKHTPVLFVDKIINTNDWFYSEQSFNADSLVHMMYHQIYMQDGTPAVILHWEDLLGGGDLDYNDHVILVTNITSAVPEPSALWMVLAGLMILPMVTKRK